MNGHMPRINGQNTRLQIIDDEKHFSLELSKQIQQWGLQDVGFDYNLVAVFGSQSTGKSTLLNRLFDTTFDIMDESKRQQTTKGIWMCRGTGINLMVMDVEGTDGRERGEDQDFERKSALFSLASSEVLIVNMWEHQVGLYNGANMGLLKTVFEVNLGLFGKNEGSGGRTLLLFVIRDHIGVTPLANLQSTLTADLLRIWDGLSKPSELKERQLSDYFDLEFTTLPHKILAPEQFEVQVQSLRKRFVQKESSDYLFKPAYHKRIPADGVAYYMEGIWEQVQSNKDLDLPTQQELLAQFRCDEISAGALSEFNEQAKSQKRPVEAGQVVEGLGGMMRNWRTQALTRYDREASRYHRAVYARKRTDLTVALESTLSPLFLGQLKNLHKLCLIQFKKALLEGLKGEEYDFGDVVLKARGKWEGRFEDGARETFLEDTDWSWEDELGSLKEEIGSVADQCRKDETKKMINRIERNIKKHISEPVEFQLNKGARNMWDEILSTFKNILAKGENAYLVKAKSFNCTDEENVSSLITLRKRAWQCLRTKIDEQTADAVVLNKLRNHFEERFRYDDQGVPRVWQPEDDIDGVFKKAKEQTLNLIPLYSDIKPQDPTLEFTLPSDSGDSLSGEGESDFDASLTVFSANKQAELSNKFRKDADAFYVEAKRSTVSGIAQIPTWMYGVLVVLGWNEAMMILFNPFYFTLTLLVTASSWVIHQLGLSGPLLQMLKTIAGEIQNQATSRVREHFSQPTLTEPMRAPPAPLRSSSMRDFYDDEEHTWRQPQ